MLAQGQAQPTGPALDANPCRPEILAVKDEGFPIGLAYWPGGTIEDWGNATDSTKNPCTAAGPLAGAEVAAYNVKVDTIALMQTSNAEERRLFDGASPAVLSVVAFAGNVRSEARYIWSDDAETTQGVGVLDTLSLIAEFDEGKLRFLRWQEPGCGAGCTSESCMVTGEVYAGRETRACAGFPIATCMAGTGATATQEDPERCFTIIQIGTSGTDKDHQVLKTGLQLQKLQQGSLTKAYESIAAGVGDVLGLNE